jgi:hypothetical protein
MKQKTKILAAFAVASALIFASCSNSDSAMPEKVKNSAIAQPGEGLKVEVYKIDPAVLDLSKGSEWGEGLEDQIGRSGSGLTLCEGADTETGNVEWNGGVIHGCQEEYVVVHYTGTITAPGDAGQSRSVVMTMAADDGNSLSIDGNSVIDSWVAKGCTNTTGELTMEAGKPVAIDAWYFQFRGGSCAGLYWQIDGSEIAVIPPSAFTPGDLEAPETSVAPEEETTTTVAGEVSTSPVDAPTEVVVDDKAKDFTCSESCVAGFAAAAGLPNGEVSVSVDGGAPIALTGANSVPLSADASSLVFTVASDGKTKDITVAVKRTAVEASDTTVAPAEESDTTVAAETDSGTSDDSSGSSPILWIIIALIVIAVIAYLVRRSQASKA